MEEAQAHLQHLDLELKLCESDERALDRLLSQESTESERRESQPSMGDGEGGVRTPSPSVRWGCGSRSGSVAADVDDEMQVQICLDVDDTGAGVESSGRGEANEGSNRTASTEAMRSERLARARGRLSAEKARREAALAQTEAQLEAASAAARARLEAAAAQLIEAEVEAAAAAQEEKEAADASASAWSQVHMKRVRSAPPRGTAAQRAEEETRAARERAQEEMRLQQARAKLKGAHERLQQTERELTVCKAEETELRKAEERALRALDGTEPQPPCQQESSFVISEEIVLELASSRGEIDIPDEAGPAVDPVLRLEMEARSRLEATQSKEAKREERLRRARGRLGAERRRREKAEVEAQAQLDARARDGASKLGWSPVALRSPTEIISGLGPVQRRDPPGRSRSTLRPTSSPSTRSPVHQTPMVRKDGEVWAAGEAQAASPDTAISTSPSTLAAQRWLSNAMQPPPEKPRSTMSLMGSVGGSRRRVAVVPSFASCTPEPLDRQGLVASRILPVDETLRIPDSSLAAQRWLSTAILEQRESEFRENRENREDDEEDDANQTTLDVARI